MRYIVVTLVMLTAVALLAGCSKQETSTQSTQWKTYTDTTGAYSFQYPPTWSVEVLPDMNGVLLMCPTVEAEWQANVFFELRTDQESRSLDKMLESLVPNLKKEKAGFMLTSSGVGSLPSGFDAGRIEYTHSSDGTGLTDTETIVVLGKDKLLFVLASTATLVKRKYQATLQRVVDSIAKQ